MATPTRFTLTTSLGVSLSGRGATAGARVRDALAGAGLTMRSAFTLTQLAGGALTQQALIDLLGVDPSALVAVLNELEGQGLVSRERDPADRRRHIVTLTGDGAAALRTVEMVLGKTDDELFAPLSATERVELARLLAKVADAEACGSEG